VKAKFRICHCEICFIKSWQSIIWNLAVEYFFIVKIMDCFVALLLTMTRWRYLPHTTTHTHNGAARNANIRQKHKY
ncbi:hypothetical protein, partial [Helicobacter ganmani]|uniref:hypothetical protein n=1 Tax=Helicobacter ganmani TaxID=60246 RepID=UPI003A85EBA8